MPLVLLIRNPEVGAEVGRLHILIDTGRGVLISITGTGCCLGEGAERPRGGACCVMDRDECGPSGPLPVMVMIARALFPRVDGVDRGKSAGPTSPPS